MRHQVRMIFFCAAISLIAMSSATAGTRSANGSGSNPSVYPNSESGLKHLIRDLLAAAKANDHTKLAELTDSMVLPSPEEWFLRVFGSEWGSVYAKLYKENQGRASTDLENIFSDAVTQNYSIDAVTQFKNSCDYSADQDEYPMLAARVIPEPFSLVRFAKGDQLRTLRFLAYVDGRFRFLGLLKVPAELYPGVRKAMGLPNDAPEPTLPLMVATDVQMAKVIHQVSPAYPTSARQLHIEAKVIVHAIVNQDGTVGDLRVMRGQCPFAKEALDALKLWKFSPTLYKGAPVKISSIFELNFNLSR